MAKVFTPEHRERIRLSKLGKPRPDMIGDKNFAKRPEVRAKISKSLQTRVVYWTDKMSVATKRRFANGEIFGFKKVWANDQEAFNGAKNARWKGENVSYRNLHRWVERELGKPDTCGSCLKSRLTQRQIHWANKSGNYKRDLTDWVRLCAKCHKAYDRNKLVLL